VTQIPGTCEQVTAFSRWERELPKLLGDPRFGAVASTKDRRALFDDFCKEVGTTARAGSKPGKKGAIAHTMASSPSLFEVILHCCTVYR